MKSAKQRFLAVLMGVAAASAVSFGVAPQAGAATCPSGAGCMWTGANYTGSPLNWTPGNGCRNSYTGARSGINNTGYGIDVYSGPNCTGTRVAMGSSNYGFAAQSFWSCRDCRMGE